MKKGKTRKKHKAEAELQKAENWWAGLSVGEKLFAHELGKLARSFKTGVLASLVVSPENAVNLVETLHMGSAGPVKKKTFGPSTKDRIEGNTLN
jgi:hypothetical protein